MKKEVAESWKNRGSAAGVLSNRMLNLEEQRINSRSFEKDIAESGRTEDQQQEF